MPMISIREASALSRRRFTDEQIAEIRASPESDSELAKQLGVSRITIWKIRHRQLYRRTTADLIALKEAYVWGLAWERWMQEQPR